LKGQSIWGVAEPRRRSNSGDAIRLVKPRILVVEDEQVIAEPLAEKSLEREGFVP
jgi:hypothetical protein